MKNLVLCTIAFLFAFFLTNLKSSHAASDHCMLIEIPMQQRVSSSSMIIEGEVLSKESYWNAAHNMIYTSYQVKVYKVFKGNPVNEITVVNIGGQVGQSIINASSNYSYEVGDQAVMFCQSTPMPAKPGSMRTALYELYAGPQGSIDYNLTEKSAHGPFDNYASVQNDLYTDLQALCGQSYNAVAINKKLSAVSNNGINVQVAPTISGFTPTSITAGTRTLLTINGNNFGATRGTGFVEFKNSNDGGATYIQARATDYRVWTNTQIQVWVPGIGNTGTAAGTGTIRVTNSDPATVTSAGTLTVTYVNLNGDIGGVGIACEHINDNGSGGYTFQFESSTFATNAPAVASFTRAFNTWRCNSNMNWTIGANTATNVTTQDNLNIVRFDIGAELPAGIGGRCLGYLSACTNGVDTVVKINEIDVIIDGGAGGLTWQYGPAAPSASEFDFETILVHELGHGMMLGHVISPGAVMHYSVSSGQMTRTLTANDIAGATYIMGTATSAHSCKSAAEAVIPVDISGSISIASNAPANTICSGTTVVFTATSSVPVGTASYQWKRNGANVGTNSATFTTSSISNGDAFFCVMTIVGGCNATKTSNTITMAVNPVASVSIAASGNNYCYGPTINFTATPVNGGTTPAYQWKVNGQNVGTNSSSYSSNTLLHGDVVTCVMTSNAACVSGSPATSNAITMQVTNVTIAVNPNDTICSGQGVVFTATATNVNPFSYTWFRNGSPVGGNSPIYNAGTGLLNNEIIYCQILTIPLFGCTINSNQILMRVFNPVTPTITISNSTPLNVCTGTTSNFTSFITNGGTSPSYVWVVDGSPAGTGTTLSTVLPLGTHFIRCQLTSNALCATSTVLLSNELIVNVTAAPVVTVTGSNSVCSGTATALTLNSTVAGTVFVWGAIDYFSNVSGEANCGGSCGTTIAQTLNNSSTFDGVVTYNISGNAGGCTSANTPYRVTVKPLPFTPSVATVVPNTACQGASVNLNASGTVQSPVGFSGAYAPASFNSVFVPAGVGGSATATADTIFIVGPDLGTPGYLYHEVTVPASGTISFLWQYSTVDEAPGYDIPNFYINGIPTQLPTFNTGGALTQSGIVSVSVTAGQNFGVGMYATDGCCGAGSLKVTLFNGPLTSTIDWYSNSPSLTFISNVASGTNLAVAPTVTPSHEYRAFSSGNSCTATQFTPVTVTVNPTPTGTVNSQVICSGSPTSIQYTTGVPLSNIKWTTAAVGGVTGNSSCPSGCGLTIAQTLNNTTTTGRSVNYVITATSTNGCTAQQTATVQVQSPIPQPSGVTASPAGICLGQSVTLAGTETVQMAGFRFQNAPGNWTTSISPVASGGSASATNLALTMVSGNTGTAGYVEFSRGVIATTGTIYFKWDYSTIDNSTYDFPRVVINGVEQSLTGYVTGTAAPQSGTMSVPVTAGQTFAFRMITSDGIFGSATVVISDFESPVAGNVQWYSAAVAGTLYTVTPSGTSATVVPSAAGTFSAFAQGQEPNTGCSNINRVQTNNVNVIGLPTITLVSPSSGASGTLVTISGTNLGAATLVSFSGVPATPITNSNTQITVNVPAGAVTGNLKVFTACGDATVLFTVPVTSVTLNTKLFLQGFYTLAQHNMVPAILNGGAGANPNIADSVFIELRTVSAPHSLAHIRQAAVLLNGQSTVTLPSSVNGQSYYLVIRHRNSLETWSKNPVTFAATTSYDFSTP